MNTPGRTTQIHRHDSLHLVLKVLLKSGYVKIGDLVRLSFKVLNAAS